MIELLQSRIEKPTFPQEVAVLRQLLQELMSRPTPSWRQSLTINTQFMARSAYLLLDRDHTGDDVETFATYTLPRLLRDLGHQTERRQIEYQGQIRGRVLWPATYKARYSEGCDPNRYICRETRSVYDTLENQLLKYLLERLEECLRSVPEILRAGACYYADGRGGMLIANRLGRIDMALRSAQRHVRLRDVTLPPTITDLHLIRAEHASAREYAAVARLYLRYQHIVRLPSWDGCSAVGQRILLLPGWVDSNDLWIRLGAMILRERENDRS